MRKKTVKNIPDIVSVFLCINNKAFLGPIKLSLAVMYYVITLIFIQLFHQLASITSAWRLLGDTL